MNPTIEELFARKSVRAFEDRPIPDDVKELILRAATQAPTAGNQQLYTILDVTDPLRKARLAESCDHQGFIARAPLVLVFCADCRRWLAAYEEAGCAPRAPGVGDLMLAVVDASIAAQNAVTAAWSLGVGSCYIGDILENREAQRDILGLPEHVFPAAMLVFGYPTEQQKNRPKPERFPLEGVVCENSYRDPSGEELRNLFAPRCGALGFDAWVRRFHNRKYASDFSLEMTRSVEAWLEEYGMKHK